MIGKCSRGFTSSGGKLRLPSPVFAVSDRHLSRQHEDQRSEFGQNSGHYKDLNKAEFIHSNNAWKQESTQGQSSRKERFSKSPKQQFQRARNFYNVNKHRERGSSSFYCDSCDRGFSVNEEYQYHCSNEHVTCGLDGCTLSAHPKVVEKHQKIQHLSGLYLRLMPNSSKNPEDVAKWIAERKRNYPTKANIERRKEVEKERLERGETLKSDRRCFGGQRWGMRGHGGKSIGRKSCRKQFKEDHLPRDKRGRGKSILWKFSERISHRKLKLPAKDGIDSEWEDKKGFPWFCGTAALFGIPLNKDESSDEEIAEDAGDFSDSEWLMDDGTVKYEVDKKHENHGVSNGNQSKPKKDSVALNNALGLLIGNYESDDSDLEDEDTKAESKLPSKSLAEKGHNQQKTLTVMALLLESEKKVAVNNSVPNTLGSERVNIEEDSDGSALKVVCIKEGVKEKVISLNKKEDESVEDGDDSAPEVVPIKKEPKEEVKIQVEDEKRKEKKENEGKKRIRRSRKRGRERDGEANGRKDLEGKNGTEEKIKDEGRALKRGKQLEMNQMQRYPTLLEELLKDEIRHERNVILQCIKYVVENNFFNEAEVLSLKCAPEEMFIDS